MDMVMATDMVTANPKTGNCFGDILVLSCD